MKYYLLALISVCSFSTNSFSISKSQIPTNATNTSDMSVRSGDNKRSAGKVRIGLKLSPFSKIQLQDRSGKNKVKFKIDQELKRTLRARIDKPNHFVVGNYHVETIPLKWLKKTKDYAVRLSFSKRYGSYGEVEEHLGSLDVSGRLEGKNGLYVLMGAKSTVIKNKSGEPILKAVAGYGKIAVPQNVSSSKPNQKAGNSRRLSPNSPQGKTFSSFKPRRSTKALR
jgi:hypothetical protein